MAACLDRRKRRVVGLLRREDGEDGSKVYAKQDCCPLYQTEFENAIWRYRLLL